ncbi:MAG: cell division protein ZipA C-terminal FtsZ-binding domain-containing protein [Gammaproteobacteria bacterium]|nr:cell division protein ZipA C-terminal FtsZ-binding domain-containing protein [Gammaproteobacteria bacterium]MDH3534215.1 cell division protein ZipA C-terminal FtsZ-binding domain-containing protein [Gammaproteobacteria bacterium]
MDATTFRWVLVIIAVILAVAIYVFGQHQARLRKRNALETFTREEVDSAFIEDEQLRFELNNLNNILRDNEAEESLDDIQINPAKEAQKTPYALPDPEIFVPAALVGKDEERLISYHLRHGDFRLITGEEASNAVQQTGLVLNAEGCLEYREEGQIAFQVASLSAPGDFSEIENLDFNTLGLNCFIDLDLSENPRFGYEAMLKKVDELVRMLNVKVYKPDQELLTISDVTATREKLA